MMTILINLVNTISSSDLSSPSLIAVCQLFKFSLLFPNNKCWVLQSLYFSGFLFVCLFLMIYPLFQPHTTPHSTTSCQVLNHSVLQTTGPLHLFCFLCLECSSWFFARLTFVHLSDLSSCIIYLLTYLDLVQSNMGCHNTTLHSLYHLPELQFYIHSCDYLINVYLPHWTIRSSPFIFLLFLFLLINLALPTSLLHELL